MTTSRFVVPLEDGQHTVDVLDVSGYHQIMLGFTQLPSAGRMAIEMQPRGSGGWFPVPEAQNLDISQPRYAVAFGAIDKLRFTLTGVSGGAGLEVMMVSGTAWPGLGFPPGAFEGLRALTTQPYTEANVKNGLQFYARANWTIEGGSLFGAAHGPIGTGETRKLYFQIGAKPLIVKLRDFSYVAEEMTLRLYSGPTGVIGGTPLVIHNYNGVGPVASIVSATKNVTTTSDGTEFDAGDFEAFLGAATQPQRNPNSIPLGRERILPANSSYIVAIKNTGSGSARAQYFLDWYEGATDLPRN